MSSFRVKLHQPNCRYFEGDYALLDYKLLPRLWPPDLSIAWVDRFCKQAAFRFAILSLWVCYGISLCGACQLQLTRFDLKVAGEAECCELASLKAISVFDRSPSEQDRGAADKGVHVGFRDEPWSGAIGRLKRGRLARRDINTVECRIIEPKFTFVWNSRREKFPIPLSCDVISWGLSTIFNIDLNGVGVIDNRYKLCAIEHNIRAQTSVLLVRSRQPLLSSEARSGRGSYGSDNDEDKYRPFERMFFLVFGLASLIGGSWICSFTAQYHGAWWLIPGTIMIIGGWLILVFHDDFPLLTENASASHGAYGVSATCYRGSEDVGVLPIVVAPFEFGDIQRKVFAADLVIAAHDAALQQRPKAVDCLSVDRAVDVFLLPVADEFMGVGVAELAIAAMFVGSDEADFLRDRFANESVHGLSIGAGDHPGDDRSFALDGTDHNVLVGDFERLDDH